MTSEKLDALKRLVDDPPSHLERAVSHYRGAIAQRQQAEATLLTRRRQLAEAEADLQRSIGYEGGLCDLLLAELG